MRYTELIKKHREEFNELPIKWAFNDEQFRKAMNELGFDENDTTKVYSIGSGGIMPKTASPLLAQMIDKHEKELAEAFLDDQFAYEAFMYELGNHEYCITYDAEDALYALKMTEDDLYVDDRLGAIFEEAKRDYLASVKY